MSEIIGADAAKLAALQQLELRMLMSGEMSLEEYQWFSNLGIEALQRLRVEYGFNAVPPYPLSKQAFKLAGLQIERLQKLRDGGIDLEEVCWFNNLNPKARRQIIRAHDLKRGRRFRRNDFGHYIVPLVGRGWTGLEWLTKCDSGFNIQTMADDILKHPDYDAYHRLEPGKEYFVTIVPGDRSIPNPRVRTTARLDRMMMQVSKNLLPQKAEFTLLLWETLRKQDLENLGGISYVVQFHSPIDGRYLTFTHSGVLGAIEVDLNAKEDTCWNDGGGFVYPVTDG